MNRDRPARRRARLALAAAATVAALAAAPAGAQRRDGAALAPAQRPAGQEIPLPPPPPGTHLARRSATLGVAVGPWAAFDTGKSFALHVDYGFPRTPSGWRKVALEYRLGAMIARPAEETQLTRTVIPAFGPPVEMDAGVEDTRVWLVEIVPTARLRLPVGTGFALFADGGLGLVQTIEKYDRVEMYRGHVEEKQNVTGVVVRLGAGLALDVSERLRVVLQPLALSFHLGPKFSGYAPSVGVAYRP